MKILMLGWELPPHNSGGLGVACYHLSKALSSQGSSIDFVVPYSASHDEIDFMKIHSATPVSPLHKFGMGAYNSATFTEDETEVAAGSIPGLGNIRSIQRRYIKFVKKFVSENDNFDVIHAHDWLTIEAGVQAKKLTNIPLIVHVHATEFDRAGGSEGNPIVHEIEYQGLLMADRIFAVSNITKQIIVQKYGIPEDKIEVVHNAIDINSLNNGYIYDLKTYSYIEALKEDGYTIVSAITRLTVQKGLGYLMEAMAKALSRHDRLILLLAGDGEQRDELVDWAAQYGISDKVFFTGFVRGKQLRDAYSVSDVFVLSSVSEPFGLTALEAAHHHTALIVTHQTGAGEVLDSVFRYDFWDTDKLADQLVSIATSESLKQSMKDNIYQEYARISWQDVAKKCLSLYETNKGCGQ